VLYVPVRAPPRSESLSEHPPAPSRLVVPLDQLWLQLPQDRRQQLLQRFSLMIVQSLEQPDEHGEPSNE
jgi:hypothetical protein